MRFGGGGAGRENNLNWPGPAMFRHVRNSYHRHYSIYFCKGPDAAPRRRRRLENEFLIGGRGQHVDGVERAGEGHKLDVAGKL